VCDTIVGQIKVFDLKKRKYSDFMPGRGGRLSKPVNIAVDRVNGDLYVADTGRRQVVILKRDGQFKAAIGSGQDMKPTDVKVSDNKVYVVDMMNRKVVVFDKTTHKRMMSIPDDDTPMAGRLFTPTNVAIDDNGGIHVSDAGSFRVQSYTSDGEFVKGLGEHGDAPGQFARPKGVAVDSEGRFYVVDAAFSLVQMFDKKGDLLLFFGEAEAGGAASLVLPAKIIVDYDHIELFQDYIDPDFEVEHLVLVSSQFATKKIKVYGFGHTKK
jgi:DNA-binding beta-propeller fold protein YncE